ncbi:MAG: hypothetical protein Q9181_002423 [Wetmoreana brouardii]
MKEPRPPTSSPANIHALGSRARKAGQGILTVRFEMPFAIWCTTCPKPTIIGQGVRFNAEKKKVGNYHSTPIFSFRMKHNVCGGLIEIRTDPKNTAYIIAEGARKRDTGDEKILEGDMVIRSAEEREQLQNDAFAALEGRVEEKRQTVTDNSRIEELYRDKEKTWDDPYAASKKLRKVFRVERKARQKDEERTEKLKDRMSLGMDLLAETEGDRRRAGFVDFGVVDGETAVVKAKSKPLFANVSVIRNPEAQGRATRTTKMSSTQTRREDLQSELESNTRAAMDPFLNADKPYPTAVPIIRRRKAVLSAEENRRIPGCGSFNIFRAAAMVLPPDPRDYGIDPSWVQEPGSTIRKILSEEDKPVFQRVVCYNDGVQCYQNLQIIELLERILHDVRATRDVANRQSEFVEGESTVEETPRLHGVVNRESGNLRTSNRHNDSLLSELAAALRSKLLDTVPTFQQDEEQTIRQSEFPRSQEKAGEIDKGKGKGKVTHLDRTAKDPTPSTMPQLSDFSNPNLATVGTEWIRSLNNWDEGQYSNRKWQSQRTPTKKSPEKVPSAQTPRTAANISASRGSLPVEDYVKGGQQQEQTADMDATLAPFKHRFKSSVHANQLSTSSDVAVESPLPTADQALKQKSTVVTTPQQSEEGMPSSKDQNGAGPSQPAGDSNQSPLQTSTGNEETAGVSMSLRDHQSSLLDAHESSAEQVRSHSPTDTAGGSMLDDLLGLVFESGREELQTADPTVTGEDEKDEELSSHLHSDNNGIWDRLGEVFDDKVSISSSKSANPPKSGSEQAATAEPALTSRVSIEVSNVHNDQAGDPPSTITEPQEINSLGDEDAMNTEVALYKTSTMSPSGNETSGQGLQPAGFLTAPILTWDTPPLLPITNVNRAQPSAPATSAAQRTVATSRSKVEDLPTAEELAESQNIAPSIRAATGQLPPAPKDQFTLQDVYREGSKISRKSTPDPALYW